MIEVGPIRLTTVTRGQGPDEISPFQEFLVDGDVLIDGQRRQFARLVAVEIGDWNSYEQHISGFDLDDESSYGPDDQVNSSEIRASLYYALYRSEAYKEAVDR